MPSNGKKDYYAMPDGWTKCKSPYKTIEAAEIMVNIWRQRNDGYVYKIFPYLLKSGSYCIARRLEKEINDE